MFEQDYLMRQLLLFFKAIVRSQEVKKEDDNPQEAADMLEDAIGSATEMDGVALLSLSPESIAQVIRVTGIDPNVVQFVARSILLESVYLDEAGDRGLSEVRAAQAHAIAAEFGFELPDDPSDFEAITEGLEQAALAGGFEEDYAPEDALDAFGLLDSIDSLGNDWYLKQ